MLVAAELTLAGGRATGGAIRPLFRISAESIWFSYDASRDGQRYIVNSPLSEDHPQPIALAQNWTATLPNRSRAPGRRLLRRG